MLKYSKKKDIIIQCPLRKEGREELTVRPKIDDVDVIILRMLMIDPRTSLTKIAKNCQMTTNSIRMRFKRLKETGVIKGAIMQINPKSFGYNCIATLEIRIEPKYETIVLEFLQKNPNIVMNMPQISSSKIHSFVALKNINALAHTIAKLSTHPHIRNIRESIWIDITKLEHPENLIIKPFNGLLCTTETPLRFESTKPIITSPPIVGSSKKNNFENTTELDEIDISIIKILSKNAWLSWRKIAKKVGISTQNVIRRFERFRENVFPYATITIDLTKIGYTSNVVFRIKSKNKQDLPDFVNQLIRIPNVIVAIRTLGQFDVWINVPFVNINDVFETKQRISQLQNCLEIDSFIDRSFSSWPLNIFYPLIFSHP